jgi:hypothetical protein
MTPTECMWAPHTDPATPTDLRTHDVMGLMFAGQLHTYSYVSCALCGEELSRECIIHPLLNGSCGDVPEPPEDWWGGDTHG